MKVKVHPHRPLVKAGVRECISITPMKRYAHAYYMGSVLLSDVSFVIHEAGLKRAVEEQQRNVHAWAVGELITQNEEQYPFESLFTTNKPVKMHEVTYHYNTGRFLTVARQPGKIVDVTDGEFAVAYFQGGKFYVSEF